MKSLALCVLSMTLAASSAEVPSVIPKPVSSKAGEGAFLFSKDTGIRYHQDLANEAKLLAADLAKLRAPEPQMVTKEMKILLSSEILLDLDPKADLPASGYRLSVTPKIVRITGKDAAGAYYGTRTLLQMLPAGNAEVWATTKGVAIPSVEITDYPRFSWRGMHLDCARHFFEPKDVKRFIDSLALHKLNIFHWHLTEDQGWRIEIKKYPKLTEIGAFRASTPPYGNRNSDDGVRYGGFYTQEQIKEIVAYAAARHITIVPEIEMPGHAAGAIAAYPELGNDDIPNYAPKVETRWGVHPYTFAPTEKVFSFIDDVFTEVCELFPSAYIHMGGDEAPKTQWENSPRVKALMKEKGFKNGHDVQSYFVKRVEKILESKGRKLIGWDEIREGGLSPKATVMSWRGEAGGIASAKEGHDVVMASNSHLYFDHYQAPESQERAKGKEYEAIGGFLPIEKVYSYDPVPKVLTPAEAKHILGVQAQLWSEYFKDFKKVEYHAYPRMAALAEVAWTPLAEKNYDDFSKRLHSLMKHYDAAELNYCKPLPPVKRKTRDGSTVGTSIGVYQNHWPELAFDGRADTFFWADRALKTDDHLTLHLKTPTTAESTVTVATGGPASKNGDRLEKGVLECSANGTSWTEIAAFENGMATGKAAAGTRHLRIVVTAPQTNWLIVREIEVK